MWSEHWKARRMMVTIEMWCWLRIAQRFCMTCLASENLVWLFSNNWYCNCLKHFVQARVHFINCSWEISRTDLVMNLFGFQVLISYLLPVLVKNLLMYFFRIFYVVGGEVKVTDDSEPKYCLNLAVEGFLSIIDGIKICCTCLLMEIDGQNHNFKVRSPFHTIL